MSTLLCVASGYFYSTIESFVVAAETMSPISIKHLLSCPLPKCWPTPAMGWEEAKQLKEREGDQAQFGIPLEYLPFVP